MFSGRIKIVVVWKLDRVSRRLKDGINVLADWCEQGVRIVSVTEQIDLTGPVGRDSHVVCLLLRKSRGECSTNIRERLPKHPQLHFTRAWHLSNVEGIALVEGINGTSNHFDRSRE